MDLAKTQGNKWFWHFWGVPKCKNGTRDWVLLGILFGAQNRPKALRDALGVSWGGSGPTLGRSGNVFLAKVGPGGLPDRLPDDFCRFWVDSGGTDPLFRLVCVGRNTLSPKINFFAPKRTLGGARSTLLKSGFYHFYR